MKEFALLLWSWQIIRSQIMTKLIGLTNKQLIVACFYKGETLQNICSWSCSWLAVTRSTSMYLVLTSMTSHVGQSVQKKPRIVSESALHFLLQVTPVSLFLNSISCLERWIPMTLWSREYLTDKTGPSLTGSEFGGPDGINGAIFQYRICSMDSLTLVITRFLAQKKKISWLNVHIYPISCWSYKELIRIIIEQTPDVWYITSQWRMLDISMRQRPRSAQTTLHLIA